MSLPLFLENFTSKEIDDIKKYGSVISNRDGFNNILLSFEQSSAKNSLISIPLSNIIYDSNKIETLFDVEFTEFVEKDVNTSITSSIDYKSLFDQKSEEVSTLQKELNQILIESNSNDSTAIKQASKDVIVSLRIKLNQGITDSDFESDFPFLPKMPTTSSI